MTHTSDAVLEPEPNPNTCSHETRTEPNNS